MCFLFVWSKTDKSIGEYLSFNALKFILLLTSPNLNSLDSGGEFLNPTNYFIYYYKEKVSKRTTLGLLRRKGMIENTKGIMDEMVSALLFVNFSDLKNAKFLIVVSHY